MHSRELGDQELVRLEKLKQQRAKGYPYPNDTQINSDSFGVKGKISRDQTFSEIDRERYRLAGRLMSKRMMGKAAFCDLQDQAGKIQLYVKKDEIGVEAFEEFKTFDLGDIVEVAGYSFLTKTGEPSLHAESIRLLVKCLHPLPEKWHGLADKELRYRQRYLDLIINPEVKETFIKRAQIISGIRRFFDQRGYVEVETPVMNSIASGAAARPFITHHNTLDLELHLRIALELPLKRLVVGGIDRVYELGRVFRNEGISTEHNPEFTMLEFYQAYATYETLMDLTEELIVGLCDQIVGKRVVLYGERQIDLTPPWRRLSMVDAIYQVGGVSQEFDLYSLAGAQAVATKLGFLDVAASNDLGLVLYGIFDKHVEEKIIEPTFITRHPLSISPLARPSMDDPRFVDRFELFINGFEVANAFSELNDPQDQQKRFEDQMEALKRGEEEAMPMDTDFVRSLEYGMPPTAGEGIGIDRLVMILTGATSIRDVILFPQMRPHQD